MSIDVIMCFGVHARPYRAAVARAVRSVPEVTAGLLEGCDVGVRTPARALLLRVRLSDVPDAGSVVDRLADRSARAHGFAVARQGDLASASGAVTEALRESDTLAEAVAGEALPDVLDRALATVWPRGRCTGAEPRLDPEACAPRQAARHDSRRPRRHSPGGRSRSGSPIATS